MYGRKRSSENAADRWRIRAGGIFGYHNADNTGPGLWPQQSVPLPDRARLRDAGRRALADAAARLVKATWRTNS